MYKLPTRSFVIYFALQKKNLTFLNKLVYCVMCNVLLVYSGDIYFETL